MSNAPAAPANEAKTKPAITASFVVGEKKVQIAIWAQDPAKLAAAEDPSKVGHYTQIDGKPGFQSFIGDAQHGNKYINISKALGTVEAPAGWDSYFSGFVNNTAAAKDEKGEKLADGSRVAVRGGGFLSGTVKDADGKDVEVKSGKVYEGRELLGMKVREPAAEETAGAAP